MFAKKYKAFNERRHKRLRAVYLVKYEVGVGKEPRITNVKDISGGGLQFSTTEELRPSSTIKVNVLIPQLNRVLEALAQVLRVRRAKNGITYSVGVSFLEMSKGDQLALNRFIEDIANDRQTQLVINHADVVVRSTTEGDTI